MARLPILAWEAISALGAGREALLAGLQAGRCALTHDSGQPFDTPCPVGVVRDELEALPAGAEAFDDRCHRLAWACLSRLEEPIERVKRAYGPERVAVVAATSASGFRELETMFVPGGAPPGFDYQNLVSFGCVARLVRQVSGVNGPAFTDSTACSSGANAFISAAGLLRAGICDAAIVGGAEALCATTYAGFRSLRVVDGEPCRPFDQERKGMSLGEGAAFFVLEREPGELGGDSPFLAGVGASLDAHHMTAPDPDGTGSELAMRAALDDAGLEPGGIGYINLHGTGTPLNDASEAASVARLFGRDVSCSSTKGGAGHLLGAASAFEIAISLAVLETGLLPANVNLQTADPELGISPLAEARQVDPPGFVMSNSFGFGGNNTAVVLGRAAR